MNTTLVWVRRVPAIPFDIPSIDARLPSPPCRMRRSVYALHLVSPRILKLSGAPIKPSNFHRQRHAKAFVFSAWLRRQEGIVRDLISPGYPATKRENEVIRIWFVKKREHVDSFNSIGNKVVRGFFFRFGELD